MATLIVYSAYFIQKTACLQFSPFSVTHTEVKNHSDQFYLILNWCGSVIQILIIKKIWVRNRPVVLALNKRLN